MNGGHDWKGGREVKAHDRARQVVGQSGLFGPYRTKKYWGGG